MSVASAPTRNELVEQLIERITRGGTFSTRLQYEFVDEATIAHIRTRLTREGVRLRYSRITQAGETFYVFNPHHR